MKNLLVAATALAGCMAVPAHSALPLDKAAALFGARPSAMTADLSPSGTKIVFLSAGPGASTLVKLLDLQTNKITDILAANGKPDVISWCKFASETRLVCRYGGANVMPEDIILSYRRMASVGIDGSKPLPLGERERSSDLYRTQYNAEILDWLPGEDGKVMVMRDYVPQISNQPSRVSASKGVGLGVDMIDVTNLKVTHVEQPKRFVNGYMTDGRGNVRIMVDDEYDGTGQLTGVTNFAYRKPGSRDWQPLGRSDSTGSGMDPLAVEASSNTLYFREKLNGRYALYRMPLDGTGVRTLVASHPRVDIDGVVRLDEGQDVIGYRFTDEASEIVYTAPAFEALAKNLHKALPGGPMIGFAGASADGNKLLINASSDVDPGAYYLLDRATKKLEPVLLARQQLEGVALAPMKAVTIPTRDGKAIPGYLTVANDGATGPRPAVVLPHGGPSARDDWQFDWLVQFLAARGYAVIQPNYRGSAGYGDDFRGENAFRDWQQAINDIIDSGQFLVDQKIATSDRLAIVGWSYGGYAALQSAAVDPSRFKAVAAIAPVTDIQRLRRDYAHYVNGALVRSFVGGGAQAEAASPLARAAAIKAPVLLVHGDMDINVRSRHSEAMEKALRDAGGNVRLLSYPDLAHDLDDSAARAEMLTAIGQLLDQSIGR